MRSGRISAIFEARLPAPQISPRQGRKYKGGMPLQVDAVYENGYIERIKRELQDDEPAPGLEEVRRRFARIPGSMAAEMVADRGER
jgi:hypothetical protein